MPTKTGWKPYMRKGPTRKARPSSAKGMPGRKLDPDIMEHLFSMAVENLHNDTDVDLKGGVELSLGNYQSIKLLNWDKQQTFREWLVYGQHLSFVWLDQNFQVTHYQIASDEVSRDLYNEATRLFKQMTYSYRHLSLLASHYNYVEEIPETLLSRSVAQYLKNNNFKFLSHPRFEDVPPPDISALRRSASLYEPAIKQRIVEQSIFEE